MRWASSFILTQRFFAASGYYSPGPASSLPSICAAAASRICIPSSLFFVANLIYFLLQPYLGWSGLRTTLDIQTHMMSYSPLASRLVADRIATKGLTPAQFAPLFDHVVEVQARSLVLMMVVLYALLVAALQWRRKQFFGQHLVFSFSSRRSG